MPWLTIVNMLKLNTIYLNATNYQIYDMQDFTNGLCKSIVYCFGLMASQAWLESCYKEYRYSFW